MFIHAQSTILAAATDKGSVDVWSTQWLATSGVRIAVVLTLAVLVSWLGGAFVKRLRRNMDGDPNVTQAVNVRRGTTIAHTLTNALRITVWVIAILMVLDQLGLNLAPLLAGAGVLGVALGFGAQSLVRDFLAGFFLLLEDQYGVGDAVVVTPNSGSPLTGRIETLTLRHTTLRAADGTVYSIGNGSIVYVANKSRGRGRVTVEVSVPARHGVPEVERALDRAVEDLRHDPAVRRLVSDGPTPVAVEPVGTGEVLVAVSAETRPSRRDQLEAELRRGLRRRLASPAVDGEQADGSHPAGLDDPL